MLCKSFRLWFPSYAIINNNVKSETFSVLYPEAGFLDVIVVFSSLLFTVPSTPPPPFTPPPSKSGLKLICNENIVYGKSENSQNYTHKPQRNCTFINLASERTTGQHFSFFIIPYCRTVVSEKMRWPALVGRRGKHQWKVSQTFPLSRNLNKLL